MKDEFSIFEIGGTIIISLLVIAMFTTIIITDINDKNLKIEKEKTKQLEIQQNLIIKEEY